MSEPLFTAKGKVSWFGGPNDGGMSPSEGLAFIYEVATAPYLFLPGATEALGRSLDPDKHYVACRWDYEKTSKTQLASGATALVTAGEKSFPAWPADWGPHEDTGRVADISPGLMAALGITTDATVVVVYPYEPPPEEAVTADEMVTPLGMFSPVRAAKKRKRPAKKPAKKARHK
jgi:hypothetical protein